MKKDESHEIEYKSIWKDDWLRSIAGFANSMGGSLYVGVDDQGNLVGLEEPKRLLQEIPGKVEEILGISCEVELLEEDGKPFIEVKVKPSSFPVDYHGEYYLRSGATNRRLTGISLADFIMRKAGIHWEDEAIDGVSIEDLDEEAFSIFRREARKSKRMPEEELSLPRKELLEKLHLLKDGKLRRAAVLLFHPDPSIVQVGSFLKVGKFEGPEVIYDDHFEGPLMVTADKVVDVIFLKYLKARIFYEHDRRRESYPYAREAVREAIYNALIHNVYMYGTPIQVRINEKEMIVSNRCILPPGWSLKTLAEHHESAPYNPRIAGVFHKAGFIENWGKGIEKINKSCEAIGAKPPVYEQLGDGLRVYFEALESALIEEAPIENQVGIIDDPLSKKILKEIWRNPRITISELSRKARISKKTLQRKMEELRTAGIMDRIGSKKSGHWQINKLGASFLND